MADEEEAIRYYFSRNYDYATILNFLERFNNIKISRGTVMIVSSNMVYVDADDM